MLRNRVVEDGPRAGLAATRDRPALVEMMVADHPYPKMPTGITVGWTMVTSGRRAGPGRTDREA